MLYSNVVYPLLIFEFNLGQPLHFGSHNTRYRLIYASTAKQEESLEELLLPENAIRGLLSHHKIKTALEDGVRPGTA